jgi:uncharacterized protein DUF6390
VSAAGVLRFGRYAFPPNRLGYCGPDDHDALLGYVVAGRADAGLAELGRRFEGAYPYLRLIAGANGIADPFDDAVVDAYWIGNGLLQGVGAREFHDSLRERFGSRTPPRDFAWLAGKPADGATPHHNFHVFEVYTRAGLMNGERSAPVLEVLDKCRISWGEVIAVGAGSLTVRRRPLVLRDGKLACGSSALVDVTPFADALAKPGDWISVHWDWACEVLRPAELRRLRAVTAAALARCNQTL